MDFSDVDIGADSFWILHHARTDELFGMVSGAAISGGLEIAEPTLSTDSRPASVALSRTGLGVCMAYRIQYFRGDIKLGDIAADKPLPDTREDAVKYMRLFKAEYALIVDGSGEVIDRLKRTAE